MFGWGYKKPEASYIERCIKTVSLIDPKKLGRKAVGKCIGTSMHDSKTYALQPFKTPDGNVLSMALKTSGWSGEGHWERALSELTDISVLSEKAPEVADKFPYFIGILALEDHETVLGMLTEDVTAGKTKTIHETLLSSDTQAILYNRFRDKGGKRAFNHELFVYHSTFKIGKYQERILDLHPSFLKFSRDRFYKETMQLVEEARDELTVYINQDSNLANSLLN